MNYGSSKKKSLVVLVLSLGLTFQPVLMAASLPTNPNIRHGDINIATGGQTMNVNQASHYGIVDWDTFSIDAGYGVNFNNGAGATLNRVTGVEVSNIYGNLNATGSLYLLNSNGVIIGEGGRVLTGGDFVASTMNISDNDFLNGAGLSLFGQSRAAVTNLGVISSSGGNVLLAGYTVNNLGQISAPKGSAGLISGTQVDVLTDTSWASGRYAVSLGERDNSVTNEGRIEAMVAELRAHNGNIYALAGNNEGLIHATGVNDDGGRVFLTAGEGLVQSSGQVVAQRGANGGDIHIDAAVTHNYGGVQDVSGAHGGSITINTETIISDTRMLAQGEAGNGGTIVIEAEDEVLMTSGGTISADGISDGGEIAIDAGSGDFILSGQLSANGLMSGGRVSLWGNSITMLGGSINANGGPMGGEIYIGGGYQGKAIWGANRALLDVANARSTYISENSVLSADAGYLGKGGTVVAWSDGTTQFAGQILARGGIHGGNGGLVETSGLEGLGVSGTVDASARAAYGVNGSWLLDPKNIIIDSTTDAFTEFTRITETDTGLGVPTDRTTNSDFGRVVDVSGSTLVVGAQTGAVYVFENGAIAARLTASNSATTSFGSNIAVDGEWVGIVDRFVFDPTDPTFTRRGAFYTFQRGDAWQNGSANELSVNYNSQSNFDFGLSLAVSNGIFYVGSPGHDTFYGTDVGAVFSYSQGFNAGIITPSQSGYNAAFLASLPNGGFGTHLAASEGWLYAGWNVSHVFGGNRFYLVRDPSGNIATPVSSVPGAPPSDHFSNGFAADGGILAAINNLRVNIYSHESNGSSIFVLSNSGFVDVGNHTIHDIDVSDDGILMVGQTSAFNPAVSRNQNRVAFYNLGQALQLHEIFLPANPLFDQLPSVAIDGEYAAFGLRYGAPSPADAGQEIGVAHWLQSSSGTNWAGGVETTIVAAAAKDIVFIFGAAVAVDGNTVVISDTNAGSERFGGAQGLVYVYEDNALAAVLESGQGRLGDLRGELFGSSLGLDGDTLAVTDNDGSNAHLHIFERGSGWANGVGNRTGLLAGVGSEVFQSVALDNNVLALGRNQVTGGVNVNLYEHTGNNWNTTINGAPSNIVEARAEADGAPNFSGSLALDGNTLLTSWAANGNGTRSDLQVFENVSGDWSQPLVQTRLEANAGETGFGRYFDVSGDTIVVGFSPSGNTNGIDVFERSSDWASASTPVARLGGGSFTRLAIDGDVLVAQNRDRSGFAFFERQSAWQSGDKNLVSRFTSSEGLGLGRIAISGNTVVSGAFSGPGFNRHAYILEGPFDLSGRNTFALNPANTVNIAASAIVNSLSLGTDVSLQANNDITVREAITVNNLNGNGGNLSLQAGRSILVNDSISSDNGDISLIANDPRANQSQRDAGEGVVVLGRNAANEPVNLTVGTGNILINGGDRFENRTGDSTPFVFDASNPGNWLIYSSSPDPRGAPSVAGITIDARTHAPSLGGSANAGDRNFVVYNQDFDVNDPRPVSLPDGNGFVYSVQPSVLVNVGDDSITYGETPTAALTVGGVSLATADVSDFVISASDTVTPNELFMIGDADLPNLVETGLDEAVTTSAGGFANAGNYVGGITATARAAVTNGGVFGVGVATGAAGNLNVAQATLNVRPDDASRQYGTADPSFSVTYTGLVSGDIAADIDTAPIVSSNAVLDSDVGAYTISAAGGVDNNYILNINGSGLLTINPFDLTITGIAGTDRTYDASTAAQFTGTATIGVLAVAADDVNLSGTLTATASFADKNVGTDKALSFAGYGLNGADIGNYNLILPQGLTADVSPLAVQASGLTALDRDYDATTVAALQGTASVTALAGDTLAVTGTALGSFDDKNVGENKAVNLTGLSLSGADASNYVLVADTGIAASVSALDLNVTGLTANNRVYDTTDAASLSGVGTVLAIAGDTVSLTGTATGNFDDKNVGTGKAVSVSGLTLGGADASNYNLIVPTGLRSDVSQAGLQVTGLSAQSRVYDATTTALLIGEAVISALATDTVSVQGTAVAAFGDKNVGTAKAVTVNGLSLAGADAANYNILQPAGLSADITARPITITGLTIDDKVYDATTATTTSGTASFSGVLAGDTAGIDGSAASYGFEDKNVGSDKNIDITGVVITGTDAANYDATTAGLSADITPASLNINGVSAANRVYNAGTEVVLSGGAVQGVLASDDIDLDVSNAIGSLDDKNIGVDKNVSAAGYVVTGVDAGNYNLVQPTGLFATITAAALNILGLNGDKIYDGLASTALSFTGLDAVFGSDDVSIDTNAVAAAYDDKNAGRARDITITGNLGLSGVDAGNYNLTQPTNLSGDIAQRGITVEGLTIADKEYDGTTVGAIGGTGTFGGAIAGDDLQIDVGVVNVAFADKNVGEDKAVSLSGVSLTGVDAANYTAATPTGITGSITALDLNVEGVTAEDKVYDRTAVATLTGTGNLVGAITGDILVLDELARTGSFDDKHAADDKAVTVNGLALSGTDAANYNLIAPQNVTASVSQATVNVVGLTAADRVYDATTALILGGQSALNFGVLTGVNDAAEDITLSGSAVGEFDSKNIGTDKAVSVNGLTLAGADANNYNLLLPAGLVASVTPADIAIDGVTVASRVYNGSAVANIVGAGTVLALGADDLTLAGDVAAQFDDKNVGDGKRVTVTGHTLVGADAANYNLLVVQGITADITPASLLLDALIANNREYDGTTDAPISGSLAPANVIAGDDVSVSGQLVARFDDSNAGADKAVNLSGLALAGNDAPNYVLRLPTLVANVEARNLTVQGIVGQNRVYDGTVAATVAGDTSLNGVVEGDQVDFDLNAVSANFADKNVGDDKRITLAAEGGLIGNDAANYQVQALPFDVSANVTPLAIDVVDVVAKDRAYDGTTDADLEGGSLAGVVAGDSISLTTDDARAQFSGRNAGEDKRVTAGGYDLAGVDANNYSLRQPQNLLATISVRILSVLGLSVADKFFDGTINAVIAGGALAGIITGDDVRLTGEGSGQFIDPEIGDDKPVIISDFSLEGDDAANYEISKEPQTSGNILRDLEIITDIIPAEVLRASTEAAIAEERQALTEFANAQADTLVVIDYEQFNDDVRAGIVVNKPIQAILDTPLEAQDLVTKNYIAVATEAKGATQYAQNMAWEYRRFARIYKESGQELNQNVRELQVENSLRDDFVTQVDRASVELVKLDDNIAQIQQAKTRISRYRARINEVERLGLGAEAAEYEQIIRDAEAIVATEAQVRAERADMAATLDENQRDLDASEAKVTELGERQTELKETIEKSETAVANLRKETERAKQKAAELAEKMADAKAAGAKAYANKAKNLAQSKAAAESELTALKALTASSVATDTAAKMVDQDVVVQLYAEKLNEAKQVTQTVGGGLAQSLSANTLDYAKALADRVNAGGTLDDPNVMRDNLVQSVPALAKLQSQYDAKLAAQQQKLAAMEARISKRVEADKFTLRGVLGAEKIEAYERESLNNRLNQLTNGALDLSSVPKTDASGRAIPDIERMSIAILNRQLNPPTVAAPRDEFADGMQRRMSSLVAQELGFSPEQALDNPNLVVAEVQERLPFNSDGSIDKEQLATNLKDATAAYVRLKGSMKDQALKQAAEQDSTGTLKIYTNAEEAARAEFVKEYGAQPEELFIQKAQERIDAYKNADSPEALLALYAEDNLGGAGNLDAAKAAFDGIKAGDNPVDVLKSMANAKSAGEGGGAANLEAARAAKTAMAMESAAIAAAEDADKTGLFKANNAIKGAAEKEFAAVFGGTPQELGVEALENPTAALAKVKSAATDILTTPDGAVNVASIGISTASNAIDATLATAQQQIDNFASKLGGPGKAAAFVAKHGITAATEAKDFLQDLGSTLTGGLIKKSGPSESEIQAAVAYQKARSDLAAAKAQKEEDDFLREYIQIAQDMAKLKYQLAVGVNNAKKQVGQYVMAAKQQGDRQTYHDTVRETTQEGLRAVIAEGVREKMEYAQTKVNELGQSPEQLAAKAAIWES